MLVPHLLVLHVNHRRVEDVQRSIKLPVRCFTLLLRTLSIVIGNVGNPRLRPQAVAEPVATLLAIGGEG